MKSYNELKAELKAIQEDLEIARNRERPDAIKKVRQLRNDFNLSLGVIKGSLSESRVQHLLWERATEQSADFVEKELENALVFGRKTDVWDYAARILNEKFTDGICLEFGVAGGASINWLSKLLPTFQFVGFDSFYGLKEDWTGHHATKGKFSQNGKLPKVNPNVALIKGWFDETLPKYIKENSLDSLCFIHIDGDTYEAAKAVFEVLGGSLKPGMFLLFDELIGYPNWQNGELKALQEAQDKFRFSFEYLAFSSEQALIQIVP